MNNLGSCLEDFEVSKLVDAQSCIIGSNPVSTMPFTSVYLRSHKALVNTTGASTGFRVRWRAILTSGLWEAEARSQVEDYWDRVS